MGFVARLAAVLAWAKPGPAESKNHSGDPVSVERPTVTWAVSDDIADMVCPNCADVGAKEKLLTVSFRSPERPQLSHAAVLACPRCTARFYDRQIVADYEDDAMIDRGRLAFYIQQGAGLSLMTRPLGRVRAPAACHYIEVGCGFGFGLDYAIRGLGWQGRGIDPAKLSILGRDQLELPIELRYLEDEDAAAGTCDVAMGAEVIEHVPSPHRFVAIMRKLLKPGGLLILTTPDGDEIAPGASPGALVPMLSPGLHMVFQTAASLKLILREEGFSHIDISRDGHSLVAYASDAPVGLRDEDAALAADYRAHLLRRAAAMPVGGDLALGFAGRALLEATNVGDWATADSAWTLLLAACRQRFGLDLAKLSGLPAKAADADLEVLSRLIPLNLASILYAGAMRALAAGTARPALARQFACAAEAADGLRQALGKLAMEDGLTEDIGWVARVEALICEGVAGASDIVTRLTALPPAPGGDTERRAIAGRRVFVALVNAGHYDLARKLAAAENLTDAAFATQPMLANVPLEASECDALFCLAVLDLQSPVDLARAARRFRRVIRHLLPTAGVPPPAALIWAATRGLLSAADQIGDPAAAFEGLRDAVAACGDDPCALPTDLAALWPQRARDQFVRLVISGELAEAEALAHLADLWIAADDPRVPADERDNLWFALATLDASAAGDHPRATARFAQLHAVLPTGHHLFWPTVRGSVALATAPDEARARLIRMTQAVPRDDVPPDLLEYIDGSR